MPEEASVATTLSAAVRFHQRPELISRTVEWVVADGEGRAPDGFLARDEQDVLLSLCLVNRTWRLEALPHLYRTFTYQCGPAPHPYKSHTMALTAHSHLMHRLELVWERENELEESTAGKFRFRSLDLPSLPFTKLRELVVDWWVDTTIFNWVPAAQLLDLKMGHYPFTCRELSVVFEACVSLQYLDIRHPAEGGLMTMKPVSQLLVLKVQGAGEWEHWEVLDSLGRAQVAFLSWACKAWSESMTELSLYGHWYQGAIYQLPYGQDMQALSMLALTDAADFDFSQLATFVPQLSLLYFFTAEEDHLEGLADFVDRHKALVLVDVQVRQAYGDPRALYVFAAQWWRTVMPACQEKEVLWTLEWELEDDVIVLSDDAEGWEDLLMEIEASIPSIVGVASPDDLANLGRDDLPDPEDDPDYDKWRTQRQQGGWIA